MFHRCYLLAFALLSAAPVRAETPFDGLYYPSGSDGWDCQSVGADMGALAIGEGRLEGVENSCAMDNPVSVRDLPAVLYDLTCSGEGMTYTERVMLMQSDSGVYLIRENWVSEWAHCN